jgi:hypothetical protein
MKRLLTCPRFPVNQTGTALLAERGKGLLSESYYKDSREIERELRTR